MPASRHWTRKFAVTAIVLLPLYVSAQPEAAKPGVLLAVEQNTSVSGTFPSIPDPGEDHSSWNARLKVTSDHSSKTGWATVATPTVGQRFNRIFSAEASTSIFFYRLAPSRVPKPPPNATLVDQEGELGDLVVSVHARFKPRLVHYQLTGSVTVPTGDETYGLSTGRVTFDVTNHLQRTFGRLTPTLTAGCGDSTGLSNAIVPKTTTSLGPLAHFRAGLALWLTPRFGFEADAVEQLPIGDQKIYATRIENAVATTVVTGRNMTDHTGFNTIFDATIDRHTVFTALYSRGLRPGSDTVAVGLTYTLRSTALDKDLARDNLFR